MCSRRLLIISYFIYELTRRTDEFIAAVFPFPCYLLRIVRLVCIVENAARYLITLKPIFTI